MFCEKITTPGKTLRGHGLVSSATVFYDFSVTDSKKAINCKAKLFSETSHIWAFWYFNVSKESGEQHTTFFSETPQVLQKAKIFVLWFGRRLGFFHNLCDLKRWNSSRFIFHLCRYLNYEKKVDFWPNHCIWSPF